MKDSNTMETVPFDGKTNGEIMLRNNTMMLGYLKNSKATQEAYRNDWYRIRDFGIRHPDRAKDIIVCGGEAISTFKMEPLLLSKVLKAVVMGKTIVWEKVLVHL
ncbi:hypothetical protein FEM48_ZijujUnG0118900 [Ziziphus jujuba var. spinosa]|uniref:AMP-dependent synthetase/ligase domain-containing protein n=1 Tax=Ziziphus jujuba var. spinosa TaxID=714518 RepID=A0A978U7X3_ZIZJJ|nr:hypothetical protein FEM48_ZijujUnG0118900 [Ziziphus jujuba var. spinosa]